MPAPMIPVPDRMPKAETSPCVARLSAGCPASSQGGLPVARGMEKNMSRIEINPCKTVEASVLYASCLEAARINPHVKVLFA